MDAGWENAVESALGHLIEGVLVDDPASLVDALGELGDGHLALVANGDDELKVAPTSLAARVRGPVAIRRLLAHLHAARTFPKRRRCRAACRKVIRSSPRVASAWARAGCAYRAPARPAGCAAARTRDPELREQIEQLQDREAELEEQLAGFREQLHAAEQQREDAQRALYQAHRAVSELAGQLQGQQGKVEAARTRIDRIEGELKQLQETIEANNEQAREARSRLESAVSSMGDTSRPGSGWRANAAS